MIREQLETAQGTADEVSATRFTAAEEDLVESQSHLKAEREENRRLLAVR